MPQKCDKVEKRISPMGGSVDRWLSEKAKLDGAEGLWRIHDKLYDFTLWARIHPGGKFWVEISRGTDITEAFESHHFSNATESVLQRFYRREALTPRYFFTVFHENGFYKTFKRKILQRQLSTSKEPSPTLRYMNDGLAVAVFLTSLLGANWGIPWIIVSGIILGLLTASSHSFFHAKDNWRVYYFNLSLMSSREWRIRHVLGHHQYRNTLLDLEIPVWRPFFPNHENFTKYIKLMLNLLLFPVTAHNQFFQRFLGVFLSKKLGFHREELVAFSLPLFMLSFSGVQLREIFIAWNLILMVGSFVFCLISSSFLKNKVEINSEENERHEKDFGAVQLSHTGQDLVDNESLFSLLNPFRRNVLHYLCPIINSGSLSKLVPVLEETIGEFNIGYLKSSEEFLGGPQNKMPQGHVFFG